jgi:hypothetical protein
LKIRKKGFAKIRKKLSIEQELLEAGQGKGTDLLPSPPANPERNAFASTLILTQ